MMGWSVLCGWLSYNPLQTHKETWKLLQSEQTISICRLNTNRISIGLLLSHPIMWTDWNGSKYKECPLSNRRDKDSSNHNQCKSQSQADYTVRASLNKSSKFNKMHTTFICDKFLTYIYSLIHDCVLCKRCLTTKLQRLVIEDFRVKAKLCSFWSYISLGSYVRVQWTEQAVRVRVTFHCNVIIISSLARIEF